MWDNNLEALQDLSLQNHKMISSCTLTLRVLFGRTMLFITAASSSTVTASPAFKVQQRSTRVKAHTGIASLNIHNIRLTEDKTEKARMHTKDCNSELCIVVSISLNQSIWSCSFVKFWRDKIFIDEHRSVRQLSGAWVRDTIMKLNC